VDFSKAFDSVKWSAIAAELGYWQAPQEFVDDVFRVMKGHTIRVRVDGNLSDPIPVGVGVLQGDTLAPYLFIMVLDSILRQLPQEHGLLLSAPEKKMSTRQKSVYVSPPETRLCALAFADDVSLLAHTPESLQTLFTTFENATLKVGK
jgi:hypothetical protein